MDALEIDKRLGELGKDVHTVLRVTSGLISQMQVYQQREKEELHVKENLEERLGTQAQHLERQNREIEQLRAVIKSMQDERTEALKESDKEISAQNQIIKLKYELEVTKTKAKNLERELNGNKLELEQLRTTNHQLRRAAKQL